METTQGDPREPASAEPAEGDEQQWPGYPGEAPAQSYVVPARARYGLVYALVVLAAMIVAAVFMSAGGR